MKDEDRKSSSNTTPFNNGSLSRRSVLRRNEKLANYTGNRSLNLPRNTTNPEMENRTDSLRNANSAPSKENPTLENRKNNSNSRESSDKRNSNHFSLPKKPGNRNSFGPRNRLNNTTNNLRDALDTNPDLKEEAAKKGVELLKKSANPYAKAAGYAAAVLQKRKQQKEKEENQDKDKEDRKEEETDSNETSETTTSEKKEVLIKKILPILMMIVPFLLIILLVIAFISPILNAYSWFYSLFNHKTEDAESYYVYTQNEREQLAAEQAFNDAIMGSKDGSVKGIIQEYQEKYGVTIDRYLLIATVTYRYTSGNDEKLYTDDGNEDINDDELSEKLEELNQNGSEEENDENNTVNYKAAEKKIAAVASMMITKNGNSYTTDNTVGGTFYNTLIDSSFLKSYYKEMLVNNEYETRKKLVDEIFQYAEGAREIFEEESSTVNGGVVGDTSIIHLQTCRQKYNYQTINGMKVYNNPSWNVGTDYPDYLNVRDYIKGVLYREIGVGSDYKEAMKAQAIAALSYLINDVNSGFNLKTGEMYFPSGTCRQATCSPIYGCTSVVEKTDTHLHTFYIGENRFKSGRYYGPISESDNVVIEEVLNDVFGKIMVTKGITSATFSGSGDAIHTGYLDRCNPGTCFSQQDAIADARGGMNYTDILAKYYPSYDYDIINITEGLYFESTESYNGNINLNEEFHYHQSDSPWGSQKLCGVNGNISANGCNITSAAIAISLLTNQKVTPETLNNQQNKISTCSSSSRPEMIMDFAKLYGLNPVEVKKSNLSDLNAMLEKLATGNYVAIARLTADSGRSFYRSSGGHYMAIVGVKTENNATKVLVWDPASKDSSRDNRWVEVNALVEILRDDYSFILIGR